MALPGYGSTNTFRLVLNQNVPTLEEIQNRIKEIQFVMSDLTPMMREIGALLLHSSQERILTTKTDPDNKSWDKLSPKYKARRNALAMIAAGKVAKRKGQTYTGTGDEYLSILKLTGALLRSLHYQAFPDRAEISMGSTGKSMVYARVHQYGYKGIPARPVLGVSAEDNNAIHEIIQKYLNEKTEL